MDCYVGREAELTKALDLLMSAEEGQVLDLVGVRGIGKTTFLHQLRQRASGTDTVVIRAIDLLSEDFGSGHHRRGEEATGNVFSDTYLQTSRLMSKLTEGYDDFKLFRLELRAPTPTPVPETGSGNRIRLGLGSKVGPITMKTTVHLSDAAQRAHFVMLQRQLDDKFVAAWRTFTARRQVRVLITVDSAELIADDEIGAWLLRTALRLPRTLLVVARHPMLHGFAAPSDRLVQQVLGNLSRDEVEEYLAARLIGDEIPPRLPDVVHSFTGGHPYGVALTVELIDQVGTSALEPSHLRRLLARVPDDNTKWGTLINALLDEIEDPLLTRAVAAASVVRRFDEPMLAELLADPDGNGQPVGDVGELTRALRAHRLAQPVLSVTGAVTGWSRLHEFVRQAVEHRLSIDRRREWFRLHQRAADYCFRWLQDWQEDASGAYSGWYRYENPEWQAYKREWLHHSGLGNRHRYVARARFTLVFLEAFYWWGCYCPFDFNRHLIEDWERATASWPPDPQESVTGPATLEQRLADNLLFLLDHYPMGGFKPANADWNGIYDVLMRVRRLCGLDRPSRSLPPEEAGQMARTAAMINLFLAHTRRYRDPADPRAERFYRQAQQSFEALDDRYMVPWLQRERADLALERGDRAAAEKFWHPAAVGALRLGEEDDWDHELSADLYRIAADLDWATGRSPEAADNLGRAVAEAYWYLNRPQLPDEYTQEYYWEITRRAGARIIELDGRDGHEAALDFAEMIYERVPGSADAPFDRRRVSAALTSGDPAGVVRALFPEGPASGDLRMDDSHFLQRWRWHWEDDPQDQAEQLAALLAARTREIAQSQPVDQPS